MKNFWNEIKHPILALAPMAGITDSAFRLMCAKYGADVVYTEMTSIDALYYNSRKTMEMLKFSRKEKPVVLQLFGKRPELVKKVVEIVEDAGFSGIDINFGCPAHKVVAHGGGITLLKNLNLCHELVQAVCESTKLPVSVKTRLSIGRGPEKVTALDFIEKISDLPVSCLMIHGRTYEKMFRGEVDYARMKQVKNKFKGIVLGNGGLNTPEDVKKMLDLACVDGVGLARGLYGRPWLFKQTKDYLGKGKYSDFSVKQIKKATIEHAKYSFKAKGDYGIIELRKHLCWYFRGFSGASELRQKLVRVESVGDVENVLSSF